MTTKKRKAQEPMAWTCLSCDSDYPRAVKFCPACHVVSPYESGAFPSVKGQSELARLRAIKAAVKDMLREIDDGRTKHRLFAADVALYLHDILAGRGPKERDNKK